ncbi:MAG: hypothetical protein NTX50_06485 [Candidatus Sumerlaeota bacterium]|nr:hypothetical protein [Candidatus Sumerlaeota bacterium]
MKHPAMFFSGPTWLCLAAITLCFAAFDKSAQAVPIDQGLAGYWKMDDTTGTKTVDSSGAGKDGYTSGPVVWITTGYYQGALRFNTGTYTAVSIPPLDLGGANVTITAWIRRLNQAATSNSLLACRDTNTSAVFGIRGNTLNYTWNNGSLFYQNPATSLTLNAWTFVALAVEPSTGTIYVFNPTNRSRQIAVNKAAHNPQQFGGTTYLAFDPVFNTYLRCELDDVRVYDRALTIPELDYLSSLGGPATGPNPPSPSTNVTTEPTLTWLPAADALSHDVYFSTNPLAIQNATTASPEYMGNFTAASYQPAPLAYNQIYYWRVDEVSSITIKKGAIWMFTTVVAPPTAATVINPPDGATSVPLGATLSWTPGARTTTNSVYFGTTNPPPLITNQTTATYTPGALIPGMTYYWRIDEHNAGGSAGGAVWSFTTAMSLPGQATRPNPANGAIDIAGSPTLSWTAGAGAMSHEVYFGTANPPAFITTQTATVFDPGALATSTTYYWRIDERNIAGVTTGTVWIFTTAAPPPSPATNPIPPDGATNVVTTGILLAWTPGAGATSHDVYFGTSISLTFIGNQPAATYDPGILISGMTYYWRIDERNGNGVTTGTVWTFTAQNYLDPIAYWKLDETAGTIAKDSSGSGKDGQVTGTAVWLPNAGYLHGALRGNATNTATSVPALRLYSNYVTLSAWIKRNGAQAGNAGIFTCRAGATATSLRIVVGGAIHSLSLLWNGASHNAPALILPDVQWTFVAATVEPTQIIIYLGGASTLTSQTIPGAYAIEEFDAPLSLGFDATGANRHFNGDMDDMRLYNRALAPDEMIALWRLGGPALNPNPPDGAINVGTSPLLTWSPAPTALLHDIYFGTDLLALQTATTTASEYQGVVVAPELQMAALDTSQTYYWRVDERSDFGVRAGAVWRFTTYLPAPDPASAPDPANGAVDVPLTATLSWTPGAYAASHDVYFGLTDPPAFIGNQSAASYTPPAMAPGTVYYWRIDEVNPSSTTTGTVWSFTTILVPPGQASAPDPADGAIDVSVTATLSWTAGLGAASHDVYFGTTNPPPFQGNQAGVVFDPSLMAHSQTYYWRIDERNSAGVTQGAVWSFVTAPQPPSQAALPSPANGAQNVSTTATLSWTPGAGAASHDIYFGTTDPPPFLASQTLAAFDPGFLQGGATYYWRVDERNAGGAAQGALWTFQTALDLGPVAYWKLDETTGVVAYDSSGNGKNGDVLGGAVWLTTGGVYGGAIQLNGTDTAVSISALNLNSNHVTISAWVRRNGTQVNNTGLVFCRGGGTISGLRVNANTLRSTWNNANISTTFVPPNGQWALAAMVIEPSTTTVYLISATSGLQVSVNATTNAMQAFNAITNLGYDSAASTRRLNGGMDDVRIYNRSLTRAEIQALYLTGGPASNPNPPDGAISVTTAPMLTWTGAPGAATHEVYFGMDYSAVLTATTASAEYKGSFAATLYTPGVLIENQTYYWRVDERGGLGVTAGAVWSFTTVPLLPDTAALTVIVTPPSASWIFTDSRGIPHPGGGNATLTLLPPGDGTLVWQPLSGYDTPFVNPVAVTLSNGTTTTVTGAYTLTQALLTQYLLGQIALTADQKVAADINHDGVIDIADLIALTRR